VERNYVKKGVYGLAGLLAVVAVLIVGCDEFAIQGVWQLESLEAEITVGDVYAKTISYDFSEIEEVNVLMQFTEDIKSMYFEKDGEIIKCINLDRRYDIILDKIQVLEESGGITEWEYDLADGVLTIQMAATLADYEGAPESPDLPPIAATMTWVLHQVDESIVADVNEDEDCVDSPMYRHCHRHRHLLIWNLISSEED